MAINKMQIRKVHRLTAPIMIAPILLTLVTGSLFQIAALGGNPGDFYWLIEIHKGKWGPLDLSVIYPFLNSLGLLVLAMTGFSLWNQTRRPSRPKAHTSGEEE